MESKLKEKGEIPFMGSCMRVVSKKEAEDPNLVKVVINQEKEAIYFSRARIPYDRENILDSHDKWQYFGHLGIYAFSGKSLQEFCNLPKLALEEIEKLEQLRAIENKKTIVMVEVCSQSFGIDTKEDLKRALEIFSL